jgi:predicted phosphodiesterase
MKVVVLSDIQGNLPAFQAAIAQIEAWQPDLVLMAGDLINRGPNSLECLQLFEQYRQQQHWLPIQGNHEVWILRCGRSEPRSEGDRAIRRFADWTWQQLADHAHCFTGWPDHVCFDAPGAEQWVHVTHGTLISNRDGISSRTQDVDIERKIPADIALFISGHTHKVHQRTTADGTQLVNVGSVGSPFDHDVRGSMGFFSFYDGRWHTDIKRFDYDRQQAQRDFETSGFLDYGGPLARLIFEEWKHADSLIGVWRQHFEQGVLNGEMTLEQSVTTCLEQRGWH